MQVVLISCYELGHQPFNLASPTTHLLAAGFSVSCMDLAVESFDEELIRRADLVAFSTPMHTALQLAVKAAKRTRRLNPDCHICFYGLYAGMHGQHLFRLNNGQSFVDSVVGGEYEYALVKLAESLTNGQTFEIDGLITRSYFGGTSFTRQAFRVPDRKQLPPLKKYAHLSIGDQLLPAGYVEASRGCAHRCQHCPITPVYAGRMRIIPQEIVLADIEQLVDLGAQHITFGDPDFLNGVRHSMNIVKEMHRNYPELTFDFTAKIEHLVEYRELIPEFKRLGCVFVVSAVEVLNDVILEHLDKGHTRADVEQAINITRDTGIALRPSLMPFTPWTSIEDYLELFSFIEKYQLHDQIDPVQLTIRLLLPPGSSLLKNPMMQNSIVRFDEERMIYEWQHPDRSMDKLHREVSKIAEHSACRNEDALLTYSKIRKRAFEFAGHKAFDLDLNYRYQLKTPHLTEDWFC